MVCFLVIDVPDVSGMFSTVNELSVALRNSSLRAFLVQCSVSHANVQYPTKVLGHFALFPVCNKLSFPSPPETMLVFWRSTCDNGKISRAHQLQMYHKRINIVLGGRGGCMFVATMTICRGKWFFICFF